MTIEQITKDHYDAVIKINLEQCRITAAKCEEQGIPFQDFQNLLVEKYAKPTIKSSYVTLEKTTEKFTDQLRDIQDILCDTMDQCINHIKYKNLDLISDCIQHATVKIYSLLKGKIDGNY